MHWCHLHTLHTHTHIYTSLLAVVLIMLTDKLKILTNLLRPYHWCSWAGWQVVPRLTTVRATDFQWAVLSTHPWNYLLDQLTISPRGAGALWYARTSWQVIALEYMLVIEIRSMYTLALISSYVALDRLLSSKTIFTTWRSKISILKVFRPRKWTHTCARNPCRKHSQTRTAVLHVGEVQQKQLWDRKRIQAMLFCVLSYFFLLDMYICYLYFLGER